MTTTEAEVETERVTQVWPKALKDAVRDKVGKREMTAYTVEAVERHLESSDRLGALTLELNQTKALVQQLADRLAMGTPEVEDRLAALMEVDWPTWIDTQGWSPAAAGIVRKPATLTKEEVGFTVSTEVENPVEGHQQVVVVPAIADVPAPVVQTAEEGLGGSEEPSTYEEPEAATTPEPAAPAAPAGPRDDLFARVMEKTGGQLDPGFAGLKTASEIAPPAAPAPVDGPIGGAPETPDVVEVEVEPVVEPFVAEPVVEPGRLDLPPEQHYPVLGEQAAPAPAVGLCPHGEIPEECWDCPL